MAYKGYDFFTTRPGKEESMTCRVCDTECEVERDVYDVTGMVTAMFRHKTLHDRFTCPHHWKWWHKKALKVVQEMENTASTRLVVMLHDELIDLLAEHGIDNGAEWWPRLARRYR